MSGERFEFDLAIRSEIVIGAPSPLLWEYLDRAREWKASVDSIERIDGTSQEIGEVLRVGQRAATGVVYTRLKTLQLKPNNWKMQSLTTEDGRIPVGYVIHSLYEIGAHTRLVCDLLTRCHLQAAELAGHTTQEFARIACQATQAKMDSDLRVLKKLVEGVHEQAGHG